MKTVTVTLPLTISVPEAGELLGIGEKAAYAAAKRGDIPVLRYGGRIVVPVLKLLALVGVESLDDQTPEVAAAPPTP